MRHFGDTFHDNGQFHRCDEYRRLSEDLREGKMAGDRAVDDGNNVADFAVIACGTIWRKHHTGHFK